MIRQRTTEAATAFARRPTNATATLAWSERAIRRAAAQHGPKMSAVAMCAKQLFRETLLKARRINFRTTRNDRACAAYSSMTVGEFNDINCRQAWANWRTIPRNLNGRLIDAPLRVLDLCCGTGDSTQVLAYYCPQGSTILGLEWSASFVETAARRKFSSRGGERASVRFLRQSVLEPFCSQRGRTIADGAVDLVNASGSVGCHFEVAEVRTLAAEIARVLKRGGLALIDSGAEEMPRGTLQRIFERAGFTTIGKARSCVLDRRTQLCLKKI